MDGDLRSEIETSEKSDSFERKLDSFERKKKERDAEEAEEQKRRERETRENRRKGARKSRDKKAAKQALQTKQREFQESKKKEKDSWRSILEEDVQKLKRPRFFRSNKGVLQEQSGGERLHTLKSAVKELRRRGFGKIYFTYLYVDLRKKQFCCGQCEEGVTSPSKVEGPNGSWPIPVVNDGGDYVPLLIPPSPELWPEEFDDSNIAELEAAMPKEWLGVFEDSPYSIDSLVRFIGADWETIDDVPFDRSRDDRGYYFQEVFSGNSHLETQFSDSLIKLLKKGGLFDEDYFYGKVYPEDPFGYSLDEEPHRLEKGDPREVWLGPIEGVELKSLRRLMQDVVYRAFLAGREWQRNSLRDKVNPSLRRDEGLPKKGDDRTAHTRMFAEALKQYYLEKSTGIKPKPGKLEEFIRVSGNESWVKIMDDVKRSAPSSLSSWLKRK